MTRTLPAPRRLVLAVAVAVAMLVAVLGVTTRTAVSQAPLPAIAADQLLGSVAAAIADPPPVAGELAATLDLGIPDLGIEGVETGTEGLAALAGDKRLRVWGSDDGLRLAELTETGERALVTDGEILWTWDSDGLAATRTVLPAGVDAGTAQGLPAGTDPVAIAAEALAAVDATTEVTVERTSRVAGRDAYRLVLTPRTDATLVGRIELDVDAEERIPLRAAVIARDAAQPSIAVGYTSVSFDAIDPAMFTFTPPPSATVTERDASAVQRPGSAPFTGDVPHADHAGDVRTVGTGWSTVVAFPAPLPQDAPPPGSEAAGAADALAGLLPFAGPLFSATTAEVDGVTFLLVGAVPPAALDDAAESLR